MLLYIGHQISDTRALLRTGRTLKVFQRFEALDDNALAIAYETMPLCSENRCPDVTGGFRRSRSGFKARIARPAAGGSVLSLNLDLQARQRMKIAQQS